MASTSKTKKTKGSLARFLETLWAMVDDEDEIEKCSKYISWNESGTGIIIKSRNELASHVLPTYFNTHDFASFHRQLTNYGFKKLQDVERDEFVNENFRRGFPELRKKIIKKKPPDKHRAGCSSDRSCVMQKGSRVYEESLGQSYFSTLVPRNPQDPTPSERLTAKRPQKQMTSQENVPSNQKLKKLKASEVRLTDPATRSPLRSLVTASSVERSPYQDNYSPRKEGPFQELLIGNSEEIGHPNSGTQEARNDTVSFAPHTVFGLLEEPVDNMPIGYSTPQMNYLSNMSNATSTVQLNQSFHPGNTGMAGDSLWVPSQQPLGMCSQCPSFDDYLPKNDALDSEIDLTEIIPLFHDSMGGPTPDLAALSSQSSFDSSLTSQAFINVGLHNQNPTENTIQIHEPPEAMQTQVSHGRRGRNSSDSGLGSHSSGSISHSRDTSDIENNTLEEYPIIKIRPDAVGLSGAPSCVFLGLSELCPGVQSGYATVENLELKIQWVKDDKDGRGDCIPPSPEAGKKLVQIYSDSGEKLAEAEVFYVDPCHHKDEDCFERVIDIASRSPADLCRFMSNLYIHIRDQSAVKSGETQHSGNFGAPQKVQLLWLLFYKAVESGVQWDNLPLLEFAAMNQDQENAALYLEKLAERYASELFAEGPKRIDWSDFLAAINASLEQDEGDACEDESHQLDGRSDSENSYYGDVESLSCASVEPISVSEDDLSEMLSKAFFKEDEENTVEKDEHEIISQPRRNKNQPIWKENDAFIVSELDLQHIILLCVPTEDIPRHLSTMHERWITQVQLTQLPVGKTTQWLSVILQKMLLDPTKGGTTSLTQPAVTMKSNIFQDMESLYPDDDISIQNEDATLRRRLFNQPVNLCHSTVFEIWVLTCLYGPSRKTLFVYVADREDVFPSESWFKDEDCELWMENWNWQRSSLNLVTDKVKRIQEQSGAEDHGLPIPSSNKTQPPGSYMLFENFINDQQYLESEDMQEMKVNPMPDKLILKSKGAQQAEDPRLQRSKKIETMLSDYLIIAPSDLLEKQNILDVEKQKLYVACREARKDSSDVKTSVGSQLDLAEQTKPTNLLNIRLRSLSGSTPSVSSCSSRSLSLSGSRTSLSSSSRGSLNSLNYPDMSHSGESETPNIRELHQRLRYLCRPTQRVSTVAFPYMYGVQTSRVPTSYTPTSGRSTYSSATNASQMSLSSRDSMSLSSYSPPISPSTSDLLLTQSSDESVAADSGVFDASQENLKASQSNGDLRSRRDFHEDSTETSQVKIGLTYDVDREALVVCIYEARGLKALGNTRQCKTMYVKAALLPCSPSESCILGTKPCNYQENPVFGEQFHIPLAQSKLTSKTLLVNILTVNTVETEKLLGGAQISLADFDVQTLERFRWYNLLSSSFFQSAATKYPRKSSTTAPIGSLSLDSVTESKRGNLRLSSWCEGSTFSLESAVGFEGVPFRSVSQQVLNQPGESQPIRKLSVGRPVERAQSEGDSVINLNRSNSDCTTRKTDVSPFVRMSVERTNMRRKKRRKSWQGIQQYQQLMPHFEEGSDRTAMDLKLFLEKIRDIQLQVNDAIKRLSQLQKGIEKSINGGFTEIPKWIEESEEFQTPLKDVEGFRSLNFHSHHILHRPPKQVKSSVNPSTSEHWV